MSILIKGMKMPTSCYKCPVNKDDGFGYFTCGVTHSECDFKDLPADCPLVPVPDHGRLIAAFDTVKKLTDEGYYKAAEIVSDMPTIIPADHFRGVTKMVTDEEGE